MKSMYSILVGLVVAAFAIAVTGCDGRVLMAGNIALSAVPCVLLYLTINLKKG